MKEYILRDIRFYESKYQNDKSVSGEFGEIYNISEIKYAFIGQRIARKLNELQFISGEFHHIYINLSTILKPNTIEISNLKPEKWLQYINIGVDPIKFNSFSKNKKNDFLYEIVFTCLEELYKQNKINMKIIEKVKDEVIQLKSDIEIKYLVKKSKEYVLEIKYKIAPNDLKSICIVNFENETGKYVKTFDLFYYEDIYYLIDKVIVKNNIITLKPKTSYRATLCTNNYIVPIVLKID